MHATTYLCKSAFGLPSAKEKASTPGEGEGACRTNLRCHLFISWPKPDLTAPLPNCCWRIFIGLCSWERARDRCNQFHRSVARSASSACNDARSKGN